MSPAAPRPVPWRPYLVTFALAAVGLAVPFLTRTQSEWDAVYVATAGELLAGHDLYDQPHLFAYPPLDALLGVPAVGLPRWASRLGWWAVNVAALAVLLRSGWRLAGGGQLDGRGTDRREHVACVLGLLVGLPFLLNSLMHHQTDVLLAALVAAGVERFARGRWYAGAALLGLAAALKCTPLLFVPYLLVRRKPGPAGWLVAVALAASLLPDLVHRPADGYPVWLAKWADRYLLPMARSDYAPGIWASEIIYNQSAAGTLNRWTHTTLVADGGKLAVVAVPPLADVATLKRAQLGFAATCGLLGLAAVVVGRLRGAGVEWDAGVVLAGMLLFSPMSGPAHFGLLLLPGFVLARAAAVERRWGFAVAVGVMLLAAAATNKDLVGGQGYTLGLWAGLPMWAAAAALVGSAGGLLTHRRPEPAAVPEPLRRAA